MDDDYNDDPDEYEPELNDVPELDQDTDAALNILEDPENIAPPEANSDDEAGEEEEHEIDEELTAVTDPHDPEVVPLAAATQTGPIQTIYITGDKRILNPRMTIKEHSKLLSVRATQIQNGDTIFVESDSGNPIEIATLELNAGRLPLAIRRLLKLGTNKTSSEYEYWPARDLIWGGQEVEKIKTLPQKQ